MGGGSFDLSSARKRLAPTAKILPSNGDHLRGERLVAIFASRADVRARLRRRRFWLRLLAGWGLGYLDAVVVVAITMDLLSVASDVLTTLRGADWVVSSEALTGRIGTIVILVEPLVVLAALGLALPALMTSPMAAVMAVALETERAETMLIGALAGLFVGWPSALLLLGWEMWDPITVTAAACAGAMFALALWQKCIRHELPPSVLSQARPVRRWKPYQKVLGISGLVVIVAALSVQSIGPGGPHRRPLNIWSRLVPGDD
jgi:hypothetical protein